MLRRITAILSLTLAASTPLHAAPTFPLPLPASYAGTLPCADCPGIDTRLNLLPDGQFQLRMTYQERPGSGFDQIGLWTTEKDKSKTFKGLPAGKYILHEKKAPDGYWENFLWHVDNGTSFGFGVEDIKQDSRWDATLYEFPDTYADGSSLRYTVTKACKKYVDISRKFILTLSQEDATTTC